MSDRYAVAMVTYNRIDLLKECIDRINSQTILPYRVVIVNNASTDGTKEFLDKIADDRYCIISLEQNLGGAGGFAKAIKKASEYSTECILIIDDDAMLEPDYMQKILEQKIDFPQYKAFAGTVMVDGRIDTYHRKNLSKVGLMQKLIGENEYSKPYFECELASFCGMVVDTEIVKKIGLPHAKYFIWQDDTEYSLRIKKYTKFLVIPDALLIHKTRNYEQQTPRRYDWREYFAIRNRLCMLKEHGNVLDRAVNYADMFINIIFRNWYFGLIKKAGYDWKYEKMLVSKALNDAKNGRYDNQIIRRE